MNLKNSSFNVIEKFLKRALKKKREINTKTIITFLMLGIVGLSTDLFAVQAGKGGISYNSNEGLAISFGNSTGNSQAIAIGGDTSANGAVASAGGAIAIGAQTKASGATSTALGWSAQATGTNSIALGSKANASGTNSISIGNFANTTAGNAVAVGANSLAGDHSAAYGYNAKALGTGSVAIGEMARTETAVNSGTGVNRATALGNNSSVTVGGGVALGYKSTADRAGGVTGVKQIFSGVNNIGTSTATSDNNIGAVSVGASGLTRQIINVAAASQDTDAVNLAQLKSMTLNIAGNNADTSEGQAGDTTKVGLWDGSLKVKGTGSITTTASGDTITIAIDESKLSTSSNPDTYFHTNTGDSTQAAGDGDAATTNKGKITDKAGATGKYSVTAGVNAIASGEKSVAIGLGYDVTNQKDVYSKASNTGTIAIGGANASGYQSMAMGSLAKGEGLSSIALGVNSEAKESQSIAIGSSAFSSGGQSIALGGDTKATGSGSISIGGDDLDGSKYQNKGDSQYEASTASGKGSVVVGVKSKATGEGAVALGPVAQATLADSVALGAESVTTKNAGIEGWKQNETNYNELTGSVQTSTHGAVAIGNDATVTRQLTGLAAGTADTDAVNVAQLKALTLKLAGDNNTTGHTTLSTETLSIVGGTGVTTAIEQSNGNTKVTISGSPLSVIADSNGTYTSNTSTMALKTDNAWNTGSYRYSGDNIETYKTNDGILIGIKENPMFKSVQYGDNGPKITNDSENLKVTGSNDSSPVKITNVADGDINANSKDVVNGKQLYNYVNIKGDAATKADGKINFIDGNLTTVTKDTEGNIKYDITKGTFEVDGGKIKENPAADGVATVSDVAKAVNKGFWTANVNDTKVADVKFGDTLKFIDGKGTTAVNKNGGIAYDVKVDEKTIKVDTDGKLYATAVTPETTELVVKNGKVTSPNTTDENKVVNAKNIAETINGISWTVTSDNEGNGTKSGTTTEEKVKAGDKVALKAGNNLDIKQAGKDFAYSLKNDIDLTNTGSIKFGDNGTKLNNIGLTVAGGPSVTTAGIDAGSKRITNVAAPTDNNDAATKKYVDDGRTVVAQGNNITVSENKDTTTGKTTYTVNGKKTTVSKVNNSPLVVNTGNETNGVTNYEIGLNIDDNTMEITGDGKLKTKVVDTDKSAKVVGSELVEVNTAAGTPDGITTVTDYTVSVKKGTFAEPTADGKLKAGTTAGVVTVEDVVTAVNKGSWTAKVENSTKVVKFGDTLEFENGNVTTAKMTDGKVSYDVNVDGTTIKIEDNKLKVDRAALPKTVVTNGKNTTVSSNTTGNTTTYTVDAVDKSASVSVENALKITETKETTVGDTTVTNYKLDLNDTTKTDIQKGVDAKTKVDSEGIIFKGDKNTTTAATKLGQTLNVNGKTDEIEVTATTDKLEIGLSDTIKNKIDGKMSSFKVQANTHTASDVNNGDTIKFINGSNIEITQNGKEFTIGTSMTPTFTSVNTGDLTVTGNTRVKNFTVDNGSTISMGNNQITNVASGGDTESNAANIGDVKTIAAKSVEKVKKADGTDNIATVTQADGKAFGEAGVTYEVSVSKTAVKEAAKEAVKVEGTDPIKVNSVDKDGTTTYTVSLDKDKAAESVSLSYKANDGTAKSVTLKDGLNFKNGDKTVASVEDGGVVTFDLSADAKAQLEKEESVKAGNSGLVTVTDNTQNSTGGKEFTVDIKKGSFDTTTDGTVKANANDGIATAKDVATAVNAGYWTANVGGTELKKVKFGDNVNFVNGKGTTAEAKDGGVTYNLNLESTDNTVTIADGTGGKINLTVNTANLPKIKMANGKNTTVEGTGVAGDPFKVNAIDTKLTAKNGKVTVEGGDVGTDNIRTYTVGLSKDIEASIEKVNTQGITFTGDTGTTTAKKLGETLAVNGKTNEIVVTATDDKLEIGLSDTIKNDINSKMSSFKVQANETTAADVANGDTVKFINGQNIEITQSGRDFTIATSMTPTFTSVTTTGDLTVGGTTTVKNFTVEGGSTVNMGGNTITNIGTPTANTDATTKQYVDSGRTTVTSNNGSITVTDTVTGDNKYTYNVEVDYSKVSENTKLKYTANSANDKKEVSLNAGLDFKNGTNTIAEVGDNGVVKYNLNSDLTGINSISNGADQTKITLANDKKEINVNDAKVTGLADGTVSNDSKDAINGKQLYNYVNVKGNTATNTDGKVNFVDGTNTTVSVDNGNISYSAATTKVSDGNNDGKLDDVNAANENKLVTAKDLVEAVNSTGWIVTSDTATGKGAQLVKAGEKVNLEAGSNIELKQDGKKFTYSLNNNLNLTDAGSIKFGDNGTLLNNTGLTITGGPSVTTTGIDAGNKKITNVSPGQDLTDAVNMSQLNDKVATAVEKVVKAAGDDNIATVNPATGSTQGQAGATYEVSVSKNAVKEAAKEAMKVAGTDPIKVTEEDKNGTKTYTVSLDGTKAADSISLSYKANGGTAKSVTLKDGLNFKNGDKTVASVEDGGVVTFDLSADAKAQLEKEESVKAGNSGLVTVTDNTQNSTGGKEFTVDIKKGSFDTTTDGTVKANANDGIATAKDVATAVNAGYWTAKSNGTTKNVKFGDTVEFVDGNVTAAKMTTDGKVSYDVKVDGTTIKVEDNKLKVDTTTLPKTVVAEGTNTKLVTNTVDNVTTYTVNAYDTKVSAKNDKVTVTGGDLDANNIRTYTVGLSEATENVINNAVTNVENTSTVNMTKTGNTIKADVITGTSSVGTDGKATTTDTAKVATVGDIVNTINSTYWTVNSTANTDGEGTYTKNDESNINAGETLNINADKNIKITGSGKTLNVATKDDVTFTNVSTTNLTATGNTTVKNFTVSPSSTIDMGNNVITNVASGGDTDTNVANIGDVKNIAAKSVEKVVLDESVTDNIATINTVSKKPAGEAGETYKVGVSKKAVQDAAKEVIDVVGTNPISVSSATDNTTGKKTFTVTYNGENAATSTPLTYKANGGNNQTVMLSKGLDFTNGNYTTASIADNGVVKYDVTIGEITQGTDGKPGTNGKDGLVTTETLIKTLGNTGWNANAAANGGTLDGTATKTLVKPGDEVVFAAGKNLTVKQTVEDGKQTYTYSLNKEISDINKVTVGEKGKDGKNGVDGKIVVTDGNGKETVVINGKDGSIGLTGPKGADGKDASATISVKDGSKGLDGNNGKDGESKTRIVYETINPDGTKNTEEVATLNDGLKFKGDTDTVISKKLNQTLEIIGGADKDKLTDKNIGVVEKDGKLEVKLAKNINLGNDGTITTGNTVINNSGITINNNTDGAKTVSLTNNGLNNGGNKITNVAPGEVSSTSKDAINGSQLYSVKTEAAKHTTVSVDGGNKGLADGKANTNLILTETTNDAGGKHFDIKLSDKVTLGNATDKQITVDGETGTILVGDKTTISNGNAKFDKVEINGTDGTITGLTNKEWKVGETQPISGRAATEDQLKHVEDGLTNKITDIKNNTVNELTEKGLNFAGNSGEVHKNLGEKLTIKGSGTKADEQYSSENIKTKIDKDGNLEIMLDKDLKSNSITVGEKGADGKDGVDGTIGVNGKDGSSVVINGKDGSIGAKGADGASVTINGKDGTIGLTGPKGADGKDGASANISVKDGSKGLDGNNGKDGESKTRIVYETKNPDGTKSTEEVATLNDGLNFMGDIGDKAAVKLNKQVNIVGGQADNTKLSDGANIGVVSSQNGENGKLEIKLAKDLAGISSITLVGGKDKDGNDQKVTINVSKDGALDIGGKKLTGIADGEVSETSRDAVNGSQLHQVKQDIGDVINNHAAAINNNSKRIDKLDGRINSGLANSAAMSTLEFQEMGINQAVVGAAIGTYRGNQAVAVGIQGAPTENIRVQAKVSVAPGSSGGADAMAGIGASWKFNLK